MPSLLVRLLVRLDVPHDCGCPFKLQQVCVMVGQPCHERQTFGDCDCPVSPGPPCPHILDAMSAFRTVSWAADLMADFEGQDVRKHNLAKEELLKRWADRLLAADDDDTQLPIHQHRDPPLPAKPIADQLRTTRVAAMSDRWGDDPSRPQHALRHPKDMSRGDILELGVEGDRRGNGEKMDAGLRIAAAMEDEDEDVWDEFAEWRREESRKALLATIDAALQRKGRGA